MRSLSGKNVMLSLFVDMLSSSRLDSRVDTK